MLNNLASGTQGSVQDAVPMTVPPAGAALQVHELSKSFGGLVALDKVSVAFAAQKVTAIVGPNGAGKTTFYNVLSGLEQADSGRVHLLGRDVTRWGATRRARAGMARTFQNNRLFPDATVLENVLVACHDRAPHDALRQVEMAWAELERVNIASYADKRASELSIGIQRQVELARALARDPKVLLLDEPAAGLSSERIDALLELVRNRVAQGMTVLIIEHRMRVVREIAELAVVMDRGSVIAYGEPDDVMNSKEVRRAYVGVA